MKSYPVGTTVTVTLPFLDLNGDTVTPTALSYRVLDEAEHEIVGATEIAGPYNAETDIVIDGAFNSTAGARQVILSITTDIGDFVAEETYALIAQQRLIKFRNTFQTLAQAKLVALNQPNLIGWMGAADDTALTVALIEAFARVTRNNFVVPYPQVLDDQSFLVLDHSGCVTPRMWPLMTEQVYLIYPQYFRDALCNAQVAEANDILKGDPIAERIRSGLFSEKIGESSMMFRSGVRPIDLGISRAALGYLSGFLNNRVTLTRN